MFTWGERKRYNGGEVNRIEMARKKSTPTENTIIVANDSEAERRSLREELALAMAEDGTREALAMRDRLMADKVKDILNCRVDGLSVMERLTANWLSNLEEKGVTSKDMLAIKKLIGEDVQKSQSVNLRLTAEASAVKSTDDFLKTAVSGEIGDGSGEKKR